MPPPFYLNPPLARLRVHPDEPDALTAPRPRGSRRPHTDRKVAEVRRLIEQSTMTYGEIAARTGVGRASICRWTRDQGWKRPPWAPRATDLMPTARASAQLKRRTLSLRLQQLAERHIQELEASACVDPDRLGEALELLKMAKLAARTRRPRHVTAAARPSPTPSGEPPRPVMELCAGDVSLQRAPRAAVEDFLESRAPSEPLPPRGRRSKRRSRHEHHMWMLEPERG